MSSLLLDGKLDGVPRPIVEKLRAVIRRARMVTLLRGLVAVALTALLALLVGMAFDATLTIFSTWGRAALSFTLLGAVFVSIIVFLVLPLRRAYSLAGIARIIEERHPELEERLSSSVELLSSRDAWELKGSETLIAELAKQAVGQVGDVSPQKEFSLKSVQRWAILLAGALLVLGIVFAIWPSTAALLFTRVVAPFANVGNVQAEKVEVKPGDIVIARGESLRVEALVPHTRVRDAKFFRTGADGRETSESMRSLSADENGYPRFFLGVAAVEESFRYRIHSGGALTRYYTVTVTPRPEVESFRIEYAYPKYAALPPRTVDAASGEVEGLVGTEVTIAAKVNKPLKSAALTVTGREPIQGTIETTGEGAATVTWKLTLTDDYLLGDLYTLSLRDEHGFANRPVEYGIRSLADQNPTIAISEPAEESLRMKPYDTLPLAYRAEDDYGVGRVEIVAAVDGKPFAPRAIASSATANERVVEGTSRLRLSEIVEDGDRIVTVELKVVDNLPAPKGPQENVSRRITITLDEAAETYFERQITQDYMSIRDALQRVLEDLKSADQRTTALDQVTNVDGSLPEPTLVRIDEARERISSAETTLVELSATIADTAYGALEYEIADLAETDVRMANETAGLVKLTDVAPERVERAKESDAHVDKAIERTEAMIAALEAAWESLKEAAEIEELAALEAALADEIAAAPLDEPLPEPLLETQEELAQEIAEAIEELPLAAIEALEEQKSDAEDLAAAAENLAETQETLQELTEMANAEEPNVEALVEAMKEALLNEQRQIAEDAGAFDEDVEEANLAGEDDASDLAEEAGDVAETLEQDDLPAAAEEAADAAERFAEAAAALAMSKPVPDSPADGEEAGADPAANDAAGNEPEGADAAEEGMPEGGMPEEGAPEGGMPEEDQPEGGAPEDGVPEGGMPEGGAPEDGAAEAGMPEDGNPEAGAPEAGAPEGGMPEEGAAEGAAPEAGMPEGGAPEEGAPEAGMPEGGMPEEGGAEEGAMQAAEDPGMPAFGETFELAQEAAALAARQRSVAERLEALAEGNLDQALAQGQADVAAQSEALQMKAQAVARALDLLGQPNQAVERAGDAAEALAEAAEQAGDAADELAEIAPPETGAGEEMAAGAEAPAGAAEPGAPEESGAEGSAPPASQQAAAGNPGAPEPQTGEGEGSPVGEAAPGEGIMPGEPAVATGDEATQSRNEAIGAQGQAAESFQAAAEAFRQLGEEIQIPDAPAPASDPLASLPGAEAMASGLAEALGSAAEATAALEAAGAEQANAASGQAPSAAQQAAAAAAQRTANALAAAAAQAASSGRPAPSQSASAQRSLPSGRGPRTQGGPPTPSSTPAPGTGEQGLVGGTMDGELKKTLDEYGISVADWTRLPGELKNRIRQAEAEDAPEEYREMIRSYFREIARRSGRAPGAN